MSLARRIPIQDKIFTAETLAELLKELSKSYNRRSEDDRYYLTINREEDATIKTDAPPKDFDALLDAPVHHLRLRVSAGSPEKEAEFVLVPGTSETQSRIVLESDDEDWVNLEHGRLSKMICGVKPQYTFLRKHDLLARFMLAFLIGWPIKSLIFFILARNGADMSGHATWGINGLFCFIALVSGITPSFLLIEYASNNAYPTVEIQTGPVHERKPEKIRRTMNVVFTVLVVGPIGNLIYDICKAVFK